MGDRRSHPTAAGGCCQGICMLCRPVRLPWVAQPYRKAGLVLEGVTGVLWQLCRRARLVRGLHRLLAEAQEPGPVLMIRGVDTLVCSKNKVPCCFLTAAGF